MANTSGFGAAAYGHQPQQDDRYENESFVGLLKKHKLRRLDGGLAGGFTVESESGSIYAVGLRSEILRDGSQRERWHCNCEAGRRGVECRHVSACEQVAHAEAAAAGDIGALETLERVCR